MIFFLAEYCLNSLNGTFFDSANEICSSSFKYSSYIPFISFIGINAMFVSLIFYHFIFLYHLFHKVDSFFLDFVKNLIDVDALVVFLNYVPLISLIMASSLHYTYISNTNRFNSCLIRILHSLCEYVCRTISIFIISNVIMLYESPEYVKSYYAFVLTKALVFSANYLISIVFLKLYQAHNIITSALVFSFGGTYFFMKTYTRSPILSKYFDIRFKFDVKQHNIKDILVSFLVFSALVYVSQLYQRMMYKFIAKTRTKIKDE